MCSTDEFNLTQNQRFIKGFLSPMTPYNGLLLFHGVGVGKTCTAISIAEQYHEIYNKRVLVILSSTLVDNFKKQIFDIVKYEAGIDSCTGDTYPDLVLDKNLMKKEILAKHVNKLINDRYQFMGYTELAFLMERIKKKISANEKDKVKIERKYKERLSNLFSNRLIIIDEAHNMRNISEKGSKKVSLAFKNLLHYMSKKCKKHMCIRFHCTDLRFWSICLCFPLVHRIRNIPVRILKKKGRGEYKIMQFNF